MSTKVRREVDESPESVEITARPRLVSTLLAVAVGLLVLVSGLLLTGGSPQPAPEGLPDPGPITGWAVPTLELMNCLFTIGVVAGILMPLMSTARVSGGHTMGRLSGVRAAGRASVLWLGVLAVLAWFSFSDIYAVSPLHIRFIELRGFLLSVEQGQVLLWQAGFVALIAVFAPFARSFGQGLSLLALALATMVPRLLNAHSSQGGSHDLAVVALLIHVAAAVVWVSGVFSLWFFLGDKPGKRELAARRFSLIATVAIGALAVSGLVSAWVRMDAISDFFSTGYGILALGKTVLLVALGFLGLRLRRHLRDLSSWADFAKLASVEIALMAAALGAGVALSRTPPPAGAVLTTNAEILLGQPMPPAPTMHRILWGFTPSGVGLALVIGGLLAYGAGLIVVRRRGDRWPWWRTASWLFGLAVIGYATMGGIGVYSHVLFSAHMVSHMLLSMLAPIFLVIGSPITLALRALPGGPTPDVDGPRQVLSFVLRSWLFRLWSNPFFVVSIFLISLYAVYFTKFFDIVMFNHIGHAWMQVHFLISGYLLWEVVIGNDPLPRKLSYPVKVILLLILAPFHAFFAVSVMSGTEVIGGEFYRLLDRPWRTDLLADQHYGGGFVWAFGELPTLIVVLMLVAQWFTGDQRKARRFDRREDLAGDDSELAEYNRKLAAAAAHEAAWKETHKDSRRATDRAHLD